MTLGVLSRRALLASALAALATRRAAATPPLTADGLIAEPWFLTGPLDLADRLSAAAGRGKRLAILWELKGHPFCEETHIKSLGDAVVADYIRNRFEILQLNIAGNQIVTDFDNEQLSEARVAIKYAVRLPPTVQFFAERAAAMAGRAAGERELLRFQGYLEPRHFLAMFRFVADKAYEAWSLRDYLRTQAM